MSTYYGPKITAENLDFIQSGGTLTVSYNGLTSATLTKTATANTWDTQAYSLIPYTAPCTIEFNKQAAVSDNGVSYAMISWNSDPTTNASYDTLDWAAYPYQTSAYVVYHNGTGIGTGVTWSTGLKFYIVYGTDGYIRHFNGPNLLYSVNKGTGQTVYFDSSYYSVGAFASFTNVRIIKRAWNGAYYV